MEVVRNVWKRIGNYVNPRKSPERGLRGAARCARGSSWSSRRRTRARPASSPRRAPRAAPPAEGVAAGGPLVARTENGRNPAPNEKRANALVEGRRSVDVFSVCLGWDLSSVCQQLFGRIWFCRRQFFGAACLVRDRRPLALEGGRALGLQRVRCLAPVTNPWSDPGAHVTPRRRADARKCVSV